MNDAITPPLLQKTASADRSYSRQERLLTIENLTIKYGEKTILNDISVHIDNIVRPGLNQGQVVALVGPSGIGKTQLFRCIAGLQQPTSGKILLGREQIPTEAGAVGVVMQHYPLLPHRTVRSNLHVACGDNKRIDDLLTRFSLNDKAPLYPAQLSGGQRQRIAIIQQLLCSEHFLLMDEPFSGLDVIAKHEVMHLISDVASIDELNTIIVTTHDVEAAVAVADTIWIMGRQYAADGTLLGAKMIDEIDLIEYGLAWNPAVEDHPNFLKVTSTIKKMFHAL
jgi:ABC-type nitrate/sulfonate/bicarbonate transport system ATPase subunit